MKIHYLAFIRLPTEKAHGVQIMKTCEALVRGGAEVELVVPGRKTHITEDPFTYYGVAPTFTITELSTPDWVRFGVVGYSISLVWFSELAKCTKRFWSADVVYSRDAGVLLQYLLLGRKLVYEAHTKPTFVSRIVARSAHRVIAISEPLRDAYISSGVDPSRVVCAHDAVDTASFQASYDVQAERRALGIPLDALVALYVGRIAREKGADTLARAAAHLPSTHHVVLVGSGPDRDTLVKECPQALFLPETPYRHLSRVLATADILVAPNSAKDLDAALYTSPLKAYAYLAAQKPVVASDVPSLRAVFGPRAVYVTPDDPQALARALVNQATLQAVPDIAPYTWSERGKRIIKALV